MRAEEVREWIAQLREQRIFYYKPGGYCWKHRDIRLGLQSMLQSLQLWQYDLPDNHIRHYFLGEMRARLHFWIGDWYFKAFATTGHAIPAIECLYHRYMAAKCSQWARPGSLKYDDDENDLRQYRQVLFVSSLMEMIKTLQEARVWLKFWLSGGVLARIFEVNNIENVYKQLNKAAIAIWDSKETGDQWTDLLETLRTELLGIGRALQGESGAGKGKAWSAPIQNGQTVNDLSPADVKSAPMLTFRLELVGANENIWRKDVDAWFRNSKFLDAAFLPDALFSYENERRELTERDKPKKDRKTKTLETAIRLQSTLDTKLKSGKARWVAKHVGQTSRIHRMVDVLGESAYLYLKRAKLEYHAIPGVWDDPGCKKISKEGRLLANEAIRTRWV